MTISISKFNQLDFDEAKRIAELVNFDITAYATQARSCGPGCDYLSKDKRYYITMLVKHISSLMQTGASAEALQPKVKLPAHRAGLPGV